MSWLPWAAGAAAGLAAGFALCELAARAALRRFGRYYVWAPGAHMRLEIDRDALPTLDAVAEHRINRDGERGDEPPRGAQGAFRVLVAGGSAAECYYLDQRAQWPHVLQEELARPESLRRLGAQRVHVGNVARSLVTCRNVDRILERILPRYERLDAIVFMVGASDLITWMERGMPQRIAEEPIPAAQLFAQHPEGPFGWGPRTLALRRIASALRRRVTQPVDVRERAGKRLSEVRAMRRRAPEIVRVAPDPAPMLDHFERWLERLLRRAQAKAPVVLLARQPWLERPFSPEEQRWLWSYAVGRPYHQDVQRYFAHETAWKLLRAVDERAAAVARRLGVPQLDLMPLVPADFQHWYDEQHHTPLGCRLVGRAVAGALLDAVERGADADPARVAPEVGQTPGISATRAQPAPAPRRTA
jgi:lysophospholipase L1-like esterase